MSKYTYTANGTTVKMDMSAFKDITKGLGIDEHGKVQAYVTRRAKERMDNYVPMDTDTLKKTADCVSDPTAVVYDQKYAHVMYVGRIWVDPVTKAAGFLTDDGWKSRFGVKKIVTDRTFKYKDAPQRGAKWDEKMVAAEGEQWVKEVQAYSDRLNKK